jgi:plastocyanin
MHRSAALPLLLPLALTTAMHHPQVPAIVIESGRIVGSVEISTSLASRRPQFRIYADARSTQVAPRVPANELTAELMNVVVFLQSQANDELTSAADSSVVAVMSQLRERFDPHVLPVLQGTRVEFPNYDDVYHNVFSLSRTRSFDLGRYPKNATRSVTFERHGVVQVFCHIHADMSGIVMVLSNAFFTAPDSAGRYVMENVPPGDYTIVGWHERTRPVSYRVRVVAGRTTTIDFQLPLGATPDS